MSTSISQEALEGFQAGSDLIQEFPGAKHRVQGGRKLGVPDERIRELFIEEAVGLVEAGFTPKQVKEMFEGTRPFPPTSEEVEANPAAAITQMRAARNEEGVIGDIFGALMKGLSLGIAGDKADTIPGEVAEFVGTVVPFIPAFSAARALPLIGASSKLAAGSPAAAVALQSFVAETPLAAIQSATSDEEKSTPEVLFEALAQGGLAGVLGGGAAKIFSKLPSKFDLGERLREGRELPVDDTPKPTSPRGGSVTPEQVFEADARVGKELGGSRAFQDTLLELGESTGAGAASLATRERLVNSVATHFGRPVADLARLSTPQLESLHAQVYDPARILGGPLQGIAKKASDRAAAVLQDGDEVTLFLLGGEKRTFKNLADANKALDSMTAQGLEPVADVMDDVLSGSPGAATAKAISEQATAHASRLGGDVATPFLKAPSGLGRAPSMPKTQHIGFYEGIPPESARSLMNSLEKEGLAVRYFEPEQVVAFGRKGTGGDIAGQSKRALDLAERFYSSPRKVVGDRFRNLTLEEYGDFLHLQGEAPSVITERLAQVEMAMVKTKAAKAPGVKFGSKRSMLGKTLFEEFQKAMKEFKPTGPGKQAQIARQEVEVMKRLFEKHPLAGDLFSPSAVAKQVKGLGGSTDSQVSIALAERMLAALPELLAERGLPPGPAQDRFMRPIVRKLAKSLLTKKGRESGLATTFKAIDAERKARGLEPITSRLLQVNKSAPAANEDVLLNDIARNNPELSELVNAVKSLNAKVKS